MHAHTHAQSRVLTNSDSLCLSQTSSAHELSPPRPRTPSWSLGSAASTRRARPPTTSTAFGRRAALTPQPLAPFSTSS
eukprot:3640990-Pleurochrysis_carterae.AAC.9